MKRNQMWVLTMALTMGTAAEAGLRMGMVRAVKAPAEEARREQARQEENVRLTNLNTSHGVSGLWRAEISTGPAAGNFFLRLHERSDGQVLGYFLGGTSFRTVTGGSYSGGILDLDTESKDPQLLVTAHLSGPVSGDRWDVTADDSQSSPAAVTAFRVAETFQERRFLFFKGSPGGGSTTRVEMAVVFSSTGGFLGGGFTGVNGCDLFACGGRVASFSEGSNGELSVGLVTGGACPGSGSFSATFDQGQKLYTNGTYSFTNCSNSDSGALFGGKGPRTNSVDAGGVLGALGRLADDLEVRVPFGGSHPSFSSGYLHNGAGLAARLSQLQAETGAHSLIQVVLSRFRNLSTVSDGDIHPYLAAPFGVDFHDARSDSSGLYRDTGTDPFHDEHKFFTKDSGVWKVGGNQSGEPAGLSLPVRPADIRFRVYGIAPYGNHIGGHPEGHPGIDFDLASNGDILAAASGVVTLVGPGQLFPGNTSVYIDAGSFRIGYDHINTASIPPEIFVGAMVERGDVLGRPSKPCCEDSMCGGVGCCATSFPNAGLCSAMSPSFEMFHFGVRLGLDDVCPASVLREDEKTVLAPLFVDAFPAEELVEPSLCNDPDRNGDAFPMETRWTRAPSASPNPAGVLFTRTSASSNGVQAYQWLDANGVAVSSGTTSQMQSVSPQQIDFNQTWPSAAVFRGVYTVDGGMDTGVLKLDVGGAVRPANLNNADSYAPTIVH